MEKCRCCCRDTSAGREKKQRRLVSSSTIQLEVQALLSIVVDLAPQIGEACLEQGYLCRSCISLLKRYIALRSEISSAVEKALQLPPAATSSGQAVQANLSSSAVATFTAAPPSSPALKATIFYRSKPKSYLVTPTRRRLCKPLIRRNYSAFASQLVKSKSPAALKVVIKAIGKVLTKEMAAMCSKRTCSALWRGSKESLVNFKFVDVVKKLEPQAPTLVALLRSCIKTKKRRSNTDQIVILLIGIMAKHRRPSICLVQRLISLILYAGHSSKQVYERLQKFGLCLSHSRSIKLIDHLGDNFDAEAKLWQNAAEERIITEQVAEACMSHIHVVPVEHMDIDSPTNPESDRESAVVTSMSSSAPLLSGSIPSALSHPNLYSSEEDVRSSASSLSLSSNGGSNLTPFSLGEDMELGDEQSDSDDEQSSSEEEQSGSEEEEEQSGSEEEEERSGSEEEEERSGSEDGQSSGQSTAMQSGDDPGQSDGIVVVPSKAVNSGYKLVFDNIDKNVKPRHMRSDYQTRSLHYVNCYAVKDRIDYSHLSTEVPTQPNLYSILPSNSDYQSLKDKFAVHVSRLLVEYVPFFKDDFKGLIPAHIPHAYSKEMSRKSEVVPLGVLPKNETLYHDMIEILEHFKSYIPSFSIDVSIPGMEEAVQDKCYATTLVGGDYLSVARARGAQLIRSNSDLGKDRVDGFLPVAEDWHAKVCFMEVMWKRLYHSQSAMEKGTLYQLRNLLHRRNVTTKPKSDVNSCEDFLEAGYILAAAMSYLGMSSLDDMPMESVISHDVWMEDDSVRHSILIAIATHIIEEYVDLSPNFKEKAVKKGGSIYDYSCEVLSLGLLFLDFKDAVREGDGDRIILLWKYFMLMFKATGHTNYALEAHTLLTQYFVTLPPSLAEQLKWSRFINVHNFPGHNISCDLHIEHMNRLIKTAIRGLGANKSEKAIIRTGKCVGSFSPILNSYDHEAGITEPSGRHSQRSNLKDLKKVMKQLMECKPFDKSEERVHKSFSNHLIRKLKEKDVKSWIIEHTSIMGMRPSF